MMWPEPEPELRAIIRPEPEPEMKNRSLHSTNFTCEFGTCEVSHVNTCEIMCFTCETSHVKFHIQPDTVCNYLIEHDLFTLSTILFLFLYIVLCLVVNSSNSCNY
jgi:hypothetical protein